MTYFNPIVEVDPDPDVLRADADDVAFLATGKPIPLLTHPSEEAVAPDGVAVVEVCRPEGGARIGILPVKDTEPLRSTIPSLLEVPRHVAIAGHEEAPGVVGRLIVLVPRDELRDAVEAQRRQEEPWRESIPEAPEGIGAEGEADDEGALAGLPIGQVVRFERDRLSPDDLGREIRDLFRRALAGDLPSVGEGLLASLLGSGSTPGG